MENQLNTVKKQGLYVFLKYFSLFMALVYIAIGLWFILSAQKAYVIPHVHVLPLGFILFAYGMYRAFVHYKRFFRKHK